MAYSTSTQFSVFPMNVMWLQLRFVFGMNVSQDLYSMLLVSSIEAGFWGIFRLALAREMGERVSLGTWLTSKSPRVKFQYYFFWLQVFVVSSSNCVTIFLCLYPQINSLVYCFTPTSSTSKSKSSVQTVELTVVMLGMFPLTQAASLLAASGLDEGAPIGLTLRAVTHTYAEPFKLIFFSRNLRKDLIMLMVFLYYSEGTPSTWISVDLAMLSNIISTHDRRSGLQKLDARLADARQAVLPLQQLGSLLGLGSASERGRTFVVIYQNQKIINYKQKRPVPINSTGTRQSIFSQAGNKRQQIFSYKRAKTLNLADASVFIPCASAKSTRLSASSALQIFLSSVSDSLEAWSIPIVFPQAKQRNRFVIQMSSGLTLYWNIVSQPARAVKTLIEISKVSCKFVNVDLFKMEQRKPVYLAINPMGTVPVLVDGDLTITQSVAILVYLCEKYDTIASSFYGSTPEQRAPVNQYLSWCQSYLRPNLGALFFIQKEIGLRKRKPLSFQQVSDAEGRIQEALSILDKLIGDKNYLANNTPTIADIMIYFEVTILVYHSKDHYKYDNIARWFKNIYQIPEVKTTTHQWFSIAQQLAKVLSQLPVQQASL